LNLISLLFNAFQTSNARMRRSAICVSSGTYIFRLRDSSFTRVAVTHNLVEALIVLLLELLLRSALDPQVSPSFFRGWAP
jgi:hypothetical protein